MKSRNEELTVKIPEEEGRVDKAEEVNIVGVETMIRHAPTKVKLQVSHRIVNRARKVAEGVNEVSLRSCRTTSTVVVFLLWCQD